MNTFLPTIEHVKEDDMQVVVQIAVPKDLKIFEGHFRNLPVVPGFIIQEWVRRFAKQYCGKTEAIRTMKKVKFHNMLLPGMKAHIVLSLAHTGDRIEYSVESNQKDELIKFATGRILYA